MYDVLEFFNLEDIVPLILLIWLLEFVGAQMSGNNATVLWWARGFAAAGFFLFAILGIDAWRPTRAVEFLALGVRALLAMGMAHGLARTTMPIILFLHRHLWAEPLARQRAWAEEQARKAAREEAEREIAARRQAEQERLAELQRQRAEELARQPPPPTREERLVAARQSYERQVQILSAAALDEIELKAAQEKVKQQYLREIDGSMQ